jgi:hypothetical protein
LNQLALIAPLLTAFHIGGAWSGSNLFVTYYMSKALLYFGLAGQYLTAALILAVLLGQHISRKDPLRLNGWAVAAMPLEAALWTVPLLAIHWATSLGAPPGAGMALTIGRLQPLMANIGAGLYEEFLFRLLGIHALLLVGVDLLHGRRDRIAPAAVCITAAAFAVSHFTRQELFGPQPMDWGYLAFLTLAGVWWGVLLLWRGYAVTACCHIAWNLFVLAAR